MPVYRQLIDQVQAGLPRESWRGKQLPTVRQVAVDLAINPNTVMRAYREMEIRGMLDTQQGSGTFIAEKKTRIRRLSASGARQMVGGRFCSLGPECLDFRWINDGAAEEIEQGAQLNSGGITMN